MWNGRMAYESFEAKHGKYLYYREGSKYILIFLDVGDPLEDPTYRYSQSRSKKALSEGNFIF